mmetsp:Transcript_69259/g.115118  ORF Transcript_69259/g.115118 Transcript_69259/m.115118 type:complete len:89 (+) Transcript_69259:162-428(+)
MQSIRMSDFHIGSSGVMRLGERGRDSGREGTFAATVGVADSSLDNKVERGKAIKGASCGEPGGDLGQELEISTGLSHSMHASGTWIAG